MVSYTATAPSPPSDLLVAVRLGLAPVLNKYIHDDPEVLDRQFFMGLGRTETCVEMAARTQQFSMVTWMRTRGAGKTPEKAPTLLTHAIAAHHSNLVLVLLSDGWDLLAPATQGGTPGAFEMAFSIKWNELLNQWGKSHPDALSSWRSETGQTLGHRAAGASVVSFKSPGHSLDSNGLILDMNRLWRLGVPWDDVPDETGLIPSEMFSPSSIPRLNKAWSMERARRDRFVLRALVCDETKSTAVRRRM
jgi:hypothetical protein